MKEFSQIIDGILARHRRNLADRANLDQRLEEIRQYIDPHLPPFTTIPIFGDDYPPRLDDTAVDAAGKYAQAIHRAMTPAGIGWIQFEPIDPQWGDDWGMRKRASDAERAVANGLDQSNFQAEIEPFWRMYATAGTAFVDLYDRENRGGYHFRAYSSVGVSLFDDAEGRVDARGREVEMTARQIAAKGWQIAGTKVQQSIDSNRPDDKYKVLHWVGPDDDIQTLRHKGMKYVSLYILMDDKHLLNPGEGGRLEGFEEFPTFVGRHTRVAMDNLGRSRSFDILARVKELNWICNLWRQGIELSVLGFFKNKEGNQWTSKTGADQQRIRGGDIVYFPRPDDLQPMNAPGNYGLAYQEIQTRQEQIKEHFFYTILTQRMQKYNMTQLEVLQAQRQEADTLAQQLSNGYNDVLVPMAERLLEIKMRAGEVEWPKTAMVQAA